jgi:hypothetical protein
MGDIATSDEHLPGQMSTPMEVPMSSSNITSEELMSAPSGPIRRDLHPFQCSVFIPASSARPDVGGLVIAACGARLMSHSLGKKSVVSIWSAFEMVRPAWFTEEEELADG